MKTIKYIIASIAIFVVTTFSAFSQKAKSETKTDTVTYTMPMHGVHCEMLIMKNMPYEKGVSKVKVDTDKQIATIIFKQSKTSREALQEAFRKLGYNAKEVSADSVKAAPGAHKH